MPRAQPRSRGTRSRVADRGRAVGDARWRLTRRQRNRGPDRLASESDHRCRPFHSAGTAPRLACRAFSHALRRPYGQPRPGPAPPPTRPEVPVPDRSLFTRATRLARIAIATTVVAVGVLHLGASPDGLAGATSIRRTSHPGGSGAPRRSLSRSPRSCDTAACPA
ncbi:hypothetical protein NOCARDAX2BIS_80046 [Nocardioides sp. AX2bis]|nr:hypothetical protein NOCARDAX2BIS_80046 [Nocardioides sp. AX2bis]